MSLRQPNDLLREELMILADHGRAQGYDRAAEWIEKKVSGSLRVECSRCGWVGRRRSGLGTSKPCPHCRARVLIAVPIR